jgi:4'-phosphopantetheinyl transferase
MIILNRGDKVYQAGFSFIKEDILALGNFLSLLHPNERKYYDSLKYERRKSSYLLGRVSAKIAIIDIVNGEDPESIFIDSGVFSFPVVKTTKNLNIQVTITHCDKIGLAVAFPEAHPIGIDLERLDKTKIEAMKSSITINELNLLTTCNLIEKTGCPLIWTAKEGLSKIIKTGLTIDFKLLEIKTVEKIGEVYLSTFHHLFQYKAISCFSGSYVCSIILPKNTSVDLDHFWNLFRNITSEEIEK